MPSTRFCPGTFLSTLSLRRATQPGKSNKLTGVFLSTLSLRRATSRPRRGPDPPRISIHALLAESDGGIINRNSNFNQFLSTLSLRRATTWARGSRVTYVISIHALLAESDREREPALSHSSAFLSTLSLRRATMIHPRLCNAKPNFYPRSPCGERRVAHNMKEVEYIFLSTLSLRRAT